MDYSIFYKKKYSSLFEFNNNCSYDLFISSYNDSERVVKTFDSIRSKKKHWLILPEYGYEDHEKPNIDDGVEIFEFSADKDESIIIREYFEKSNALSNISICIDTTGFIRPHLIFLVKFLSISGISKVDFIYVDPISYVKKEETLFTDNYVNVSVVKGCEGNHNPETHSDLLIIGSGFDNKRIADVSKSKGNARKVQVFGFPSLQPDMFQQNVIKAYKAEEESSLGGEDAFIDQHNSILAPANDPFITAQAIKEFYDTQNARKEITNLYLSPLSTKAQTLGFALYFSFECIDKPVSIIFPYCSSYSRETTKGISKIWNYTVEFI